MAIFRFSLIPALVAGLAFPGGEAAAQQTRPAQVLPGAPWSQPPQPAERTPITPAQLRPSEQNLIDCKDAPPAAVTKAPEPIARWATIYCTKAGHILTTGERYYSAVPGTNGRLRGVLSAAEIGGRKGEVGHAAHFTKVDYAPLSKAAAQAVLAGADPAILKVARDKPLFRLDLTVDNGQTARVIVADPAHDPFWVIRVVDGKLARAGFYVATVDYANRTRMQ